MGYYPGQCIAKFGWMGEILLNHRVLRRGVAMGSTDPVVVMADTFG